MMGNGTRRRPMAVNSFRKSNVVVLSKLRANSRIVVGNRRGMSRNVVISAKGDGGQWGIRKGSVGRSGGRSAGGPEVPRGSATLRSRVGTHVAEGPGHVVGHSFVRSTVYGRGVIVLLVNVLIFINVLNVYVVPGRRVPRFAVHRNTYMTMCPNTASSRIRRQITGPLRGFVFKCGRMGGGGACARDGSNVLVMFLRLGSSMRSESTF